MTAAECVAQNHAEFHATLSLKYVWWGAVGVSNWCALLVARVKQTSLLARSILIPAMEPWPKKILADDVALGRRL